MAVVEPLSPARGPRNEQVVSHIIDNPERQCHTYSQNSGWWAIITREQDGRSHNAEVNRIIERSKVVPLYYQLVEILSEKIDSGELQPGEPIPSELQLQEQYGISRTTVRQAIARLVVAGKLRTAQGKGTFVAEPKVEETVETITSLSQQLLSRNIKPGTRVLGLAVMSPSPRVAEALNLSQQSAVVRLERLRLADDEPLGVSVAYLPIDLVPGLAEKGLNNESLYEVLEGEFGLVLQEADESVSASAATEREAQLLGIPAGAPVLLVTRTTYLADGHPIEHSRTVFRADRYRYYARLRGRDQLRSRVWPHPRRESSAGD